MRSRQGHWPLRATVGAEAVLVPKPGPLPADREGYPLGVHPRSGQRKGRFRRTGPCLVQHRRAHSRVQMSRWDVVLKEGARQNGHRDPCGLALLSTLPPFPGSPRGAVPRLPPGTSHAVHPTQLPAPTRAQHPASPRDWVRGGHAARAEPVSAAPGPSRKRLCRRRLLSWPPPSLWGRPCGAVPVGQPVPEREATTEERRAQKRAQVLDTLFERLDPAVPEARDP